MNDRQIELYNLLKQGNRGREELCIVLDRHYHRINEIYDGVKAENSAAYRLLRRDIVEINKSNSQHKVVSIKHNGKLVGYKLADRAEELLKTADRYHAEAMRKLEMEKAIRTAVRNDGQTRLTEEEVKVISAYERS